MTNSSGWQKVRNWWVYVTRPGLREVMRRAQGVSGARAADKQLYVPLTEVALPVLMTGEQAPVGVYGTGHALVTNIDQFGRCGLLSGEVRMFVEWLGDEKRVFDTLTWVYRAHKRMEMLEFPNFGGQPSVAMLQDAHPRGVRNLEKLLCQLVEVPNLSVEKTYVLLRRQLPGIEFPRCHGKADLEQLLAVARNLNMWCAERGTLPCGCQAVMPLPRK